MRYDWILFDADGTLFDYDAAEAKALARTFEQAKQEFRPEHVEAYRAINQRFWHELEKGTITSEQLRIRRFEELFGLLGVKTDIPLFSKRYVENLSQNADLNEGAADVLQFLHGRAKLVIVTNGLRNVQRARLARSEIARYIADILISEEIGVAKPATRFFDEAFRRMGWPKRARVLLVGDGLTSDIQGGNAYGLDTCWYNPKRMARPCGIATRYEIHHLSELIGIVSAV